MKASPAAAEAVNYSSPQMMTFQIGSDSQTVMEKDLLSSALVIKVTLATTGNLNNKVSSEKACVSFRQKHKQGGNAGHGNRLPEIWSSLQKRVVFRLPNNCPLPGNIQVLKYATGPAPGNYWV